MRWDQNHRSSDLIDRRGQRGGGGGGGGGGLFSIVAMLLRSRFGWVGAIIAVVGYGAFQLFGGGIQRLVGGGGNDDDTAAAVAVDDEQGRFVGFVLDDIQDMWARKLPSYQRAKLILFTGSTGTSCGYGDAATGPFYCPADSQVYIDLSFYEQLRSQLGAGGDFAQAYVIAHEIGHHLQNLDGTSARVHRAPKRKQKGAEGLSVKQELQADCYAGVWAHDANKRELLEMGDIDEALTAAAAIGDDRLQARSGQVRPETFSHGTSAQRVEWFKRGFATGDPRQCDTF